MCLHTELGGSGPSWKLAGLERNYHPAGASGKAKERRREKKPGAAWLEAKPKYNAALVGLVEGKRGDLCCGTGREVCAGPCRTCRRGDLLLGVRV